MQDAVDLWVPKPGYLNTAAYGLPPRTSWEALVSAQEDWLVGEGGWETWAASTEPCRDSFARLIGVPASDVFSASTVSAAVGLLAASAPDNSRVLIPDMEFTSVSFPWVVHGHRGIEVVTVPLEKLIDSIDSSIDIVAFSLVQSATGVVTDLAEVAAAAAAASALVIVDASQAVGWLPFNALLADAVISTTYKWLMSPRGATFGYLSPRLQERCLPLHAGWTSGRDVSASFYGLPMDLTPDARRFDQSAAWFSHVATAPTLALLEEIGIQPIHDHDVALANTFRAGLGLEPSDSAIVSLRAPGVDHRLAAAGIRASARNGSARLAFHLYTTPADVDLALNALAGLHLPI
ncbi:aminotransferase class V-fold PLP-dependent enzyme [Kribbella albertanoniae]|nr:aminotransferase class V-fold PLP-dependent enzyme [Kribbella albertanoniae]